MENFTRVFPVEFHGVKTWTFILHYRRNISTDYFSGPDRTIRSVFVCVSGL